MASRAVLHKKNGHRRAPATVAPSPGEVLRLVHAVRDPAPRASFELLRFAYTVRSEHVTALVEQAAHRVDALAAGLDAALARTRQAFARGELADVRALLEGLRAHAERTGQVVADLAAAVATAGPPPPRSLGLNDLLRRAAAAAAEEALAGLEVTQALDGGRPRVPGDARRLERALVTLLAEVGRATDRPGRLSIASSVAAGPAGRRLVRVEIAGSGPGFGPAVLETVGRARARLAGIGPALDLYLACQVLAQHDGTVAADRTPEGGARFTVELPAA